MMVLSLCWWKLLSVATSVYKCIQLKGMSMFRKQALESLP
jgi:hypothetical protein